MSNCAATLPFQGVCNTCKNIVYMYDIYTYISVCIYSEETRVKKKKSVESKYITIKYLHIFRLHPWTRTVNNQCCAWHCVSFLLHRSQPSTYMYIYIYILYISIPIKLNLFLCEMIEELKKKYTFLLFLNCHLTLTKL